MAIAGRAGRAVVIVALTLAALFYIQFGLQALAHYVPQGALALVGGAALIAGIVRRVRRHSAAGIALAGTLPVLALHLWMTLEDPGELPFLIGSIPVPMIAAVAFLLSRSKAQRD